MRRERGLPTFTRRRRWRRYPVMCVHTIPKVRNLYQPLITQLLLRFRWLFPHPERRGRSAPGHGSSAFVSRFSVPHRYTTVTEAGCFLRSSGISQSDLTDLNFFKKNLDSALFPGIPPAVKVRGGFADEHAKTASIILTEVQNLLSSTGASTVVAVSNSARHTGFSYGIKIQMRRSDTRSEARLQSSTPCSLR